MQLKTRWKIVASNAKARRKEQVIWYVKEDKEVWDKKLTVTGLSGNCMQKEQFNLSSNKSKTSSPFFFFSLLVSWSSLSDCNFPLRSSWRFFAFSRSVREASASMARIAATRSLEGAVGSEWLPSEGRGTSSGGVEQSGQSHWRVDARVSGGFERQLTCQGVTQVLQVIVSKSEGLALQSMQMPSPSQGNWETYTMRGECNWEKDGREMEGNSKKWATMFSTLKNMPLLAHYLTWVFFAWSSVAFGCSLASSSIIFALYSTNLAKPCT